MAGIVRICFIFCFFLTFLLFSQVVISAQKDIPLHYPARVTRSDDDDCTYGPLGILAQFISLIVFVFYIFIVLGLIKACVGLCCSTAIGTIGMDLLLEYPAEEYSSNTLFCMNVIFFLALPFALFRKIRGQSLDPRSSHASYRMQAGAEPDQKKSTIKVIDTQNSASALILPKIKKGLMDVYKDGNDSEAQDTKYVLQQLHKSEQSLRKGMYA